MNKDQKAWEILTEDMSNDAHQYDTWDEVPEKIKELYIGKVPDKWIIIFYNGQLENFDVNPDDIMVIVESESEHLAADKVLDIEGMKTSFCTAYPYDRYVELLTNQYHRTEITLEDLRNKRVPDSE